VRQYAGDDVIGCGKIFGGHQDPNPNMDGMGGGTTACPPGPPRGGPAWGAGAEVLFDCRLISHRHPSSIAPEEQEACACCGGDLGFRGG
jgi:hypothetical protein